MGLTSSGVGFHLAPVWALRERIEGQGSGEPDAGALGWGNGGRTWALLGARETWQKDMQRNKEICLSRSGLLRL